MTTNRAQAKIDEDLGKPVDGWLSPREAVSVAAGSYVQALSTFKRVKPGGLQRAHAQDAIQRMERAIVKAIIRAQGEEAAYFLESLSEGIDA